jgi:hypothetical protein
MAVYITAKFSLIPPEGVSFKLTPITLEETKSLLAGDFVSAVSRRTAKVLSGLLGMEVPSGRARIVPVEGDVIVLFQIVRGGVKAILKVEVEAAPATEEQLRKISELLESGQLSIFQGAEIIGKHFREFFYSLKDKSLTYSEAKKILEAVSAS